MRTTKRNTKNPEVPNGEDRILNSLKQFNVFPKPPVSHHLYFRSKDSQKQSLQHYQRLIDLYKQQNTDIQKKNGELVQLIRKTKEKETMLESEIAELEKNHQRLSGQTQQISKDQKIPIRLKISAKNKEDFETMNMEFCELVEASIGETDPLKRKKLRRQLASLAKQMKSYRSFDQDSHLEEQNSITDQYVLDSYLIRADKTEKQQEKNGQ